MADTFDASKRSDIMRRVKSNGNRSTELRLLAYFKARHITGWRRGYPLLGKPDFVFPKKRVVIFTDGCFWHGHDCRNTRPAQHQAYWMEKRQRNQRRDQEVTEELTQKNWLVIRIWECELKSGAFIPRLAVLTGD